MIRFFLSQRRLVTVRTIAVITRVSGFSIVFQLPGKSTFKILTTHQKIAHSVPVQVLYKKTAWVDELRLPSELRGI